MLPLGIWWKLYGKLKLLMSDSVCREWMHQDTLHPPCQAITNQHIPKTKITRIERISHMTGLDRQLRLKQSM